MATARDKSVKWGNSIRISHKKGDRSPGQTEELTENTVSLALAKRIKSCPVILPEIALARSRLSYKVKL